MYIYIIYIYILHIYVCIYICMFIRYIKLKRAGRPDNDMDFAANPI